MENHPAGRHVEAEILSEAEVLGRKGCALLAPEDREVSLVMVARGVAVDVIPADSSEFRLPQGPDISNTRSLGLLRSL